MMVFHFGSDWLLIVQNAHTITSHSKQYPVLRTEPSKGHHFDRCFRWSVLMSDIVCSHPISLMGVPYSDIHNTIWVALRRCLMSFVVSPIGVFNSLLFFYGQISSIIITNNSFFSLSSRIVFLSSSQWYSCIWINKFGMI